MNTTPSLNARGSASNPKNGFDRLEYVPEPAEDGDEPAHPRAVFLRDDLQSIIAHNNRPVVRFDSSINVYGGCEHGYSCFTWTTKPNGVIQHRYDPTGNITRTSKPGNRDAASALTWDTWTWNHPLEIADAFSGDHLSPNFDIGSCLLD